MIKILTARFASIFDRGCLGTSCWSDLPDGWFQIAWQLFEKLEKIPSVRISQFKEKFGELRVYYCCDRDDDPQISKLIDEFEDISRRTCQVCGLPGKQTKGGWIYVTCETCEEKRIREEEGRLHDYKTSSSSDT